MRLFQSGHSLTRLLLLFFSAAAVGSSAQSPQPAPMPGTTPSQTQQTQSAPTVPADQTSSPVSATPAGQQTAPAYHDPLEDPLVMRPLPGANPSATAPVPPKNAAPAPAPSLPAPSGATTSAAPSSAAPAPIYGFVPNAVQISPPSPALSGSTSPAAASPLPDYVEPPDMGRHEPALGSTYIPVDSPIYPMAMRLYSRGFLDTAFIGMRPWTRQSLLHMLQESSPEITNGGDDEAVEILAKLRSALAEEIPSTGFTRGRVYGLETVYTRLMGISGQTLRDSYHLGQTVVNDYGRPYQPGFNNITGFSSVYEWGRFSLRLRGEYQHAPRGVDYPLSLAQYLSCLDFVCNFTPPNAPQDTIPYGNQGARNPFRLQEAALSFHLWGHEISGGKTDAWLGPGAGGSLAWSNNAENIYSFRINRVEPFHFPLLSDVVGPMRYDFFVGSLKGHTSPNSPWVHSFMFSFRPTRDFEFGFQRTVIWGGKGHVPINLRTFFRSFFDINDTTPAEKLSNRDPGARFSSFNFSYRLPFIRESATLYVEAEAHDDASPVEAPRRAAYRPGIMISKLPYLKKMDLRVEAADTDPVTLRSMNGSFNYFEAVQNQGYTNKGFIMGDWIGREAKGGQAWLTYHLSGNEWVQLQYLNKKNAKDFIPLGTTQNQWTVDVVKRFRKDIELNAWAQYERWKAPVWLPGGHSDFVIAGQVTFYPKLKTSPVAR